MGEFAVLIVKKYPKYQILEVDFNGEIMFLPVVKFSFFSAPYYLDTLHSFEGAEVCAFDFNKDKINKSICVESIQDAAKLINSRIVQTTNKHGKIISIHESE